jgi:hypothetical protein
MSTVVLAHGIGQHGNRGRSHPPIAAAEIRHILDASVILSGTATGTWSSQSSHGITTYSLSGSGVINPVHSVLVTATLTHSIAEIFDTGTVVLRTPPGSRVPGTLTLTSVGVKGSLADPGREQFHYTMAGTGAFAGMSGDGTFTLVLTRPSTAQAQFTLSFDSPTSSHV